MDSNPAANVPPVSQQAPPMQAPPCPLSEGDYLLIRQAGWRYRTVSRCSRTAMTSSIITLVIGGFAVFFTLISPAVPDAIISGGLLAVGAVEFYGARRARRCDPLAGRVLGFNQLGLLALITLYCVLKMTVAPPMLISEEAKRLMSDQMNSSLAGIDRMVRLTIFLFYGAVIAASLVCQGCMSLYYFTRRKHIEEYNAKTPEWIKKIVDQMIG